MSGTRPQVPVAVVGVGALVPGATDAAGYWRTVIGGRDLITEVPASRWLVEDHYDPDPAAPDKTYARKGRSCRRSTSTRWPTVCRPPAFRPRTPPSCSR